MLPAARSDQGLDCAPNFRDIGGLPTIDGRTVAYGRIFRSEAVLAPSDADIDRLSAYAVRLVCDLRGRGERSRAPNAWWQSRGAELLELDINADIRGDSHWHVLRDNPGADGAEAMMRLIYQALPRAAAPHLALLFRRINEDHLPLVVHCTAGKDRTGFIIALTLAALGVTREAIFADYLESGRRPNQAVLDATASLVTHAIGQPADESAIKAICGVREDYLATSLAVIDQDYGSIDAYLHTAAGLTQAAIEGLKTRLLA